MFFRQFPNDDLDHFRSSNVIYFWSIDFYDSGILQLRQVEQKRVQQLSFEPELQSWCRLDKDVASPKPELFCKDFDRDGKKQNSAFDFSPWKNCIDTVHGGSTR